MTEMRKQMKADHDMLVRLDEKVDLWSRLHFVPRADDLAVPQAS